MMIYLIQLNDHIESAEGEKANKVLVDFVTLII